MRRGMSPAAAVEEALSRIDQYYPAFQGALVAVDTSGNYGKHSTGMECGGYRCVVEADEVSPLVCVINAGAANHGFPSFEYTVYNPQLKKSTVIIV